MHPSKEALYACQTSSDALPGHSRRQRHDNGNTDEDIIRRAGHAATWSVSSSKLCMSSTVCRQSSQAFQYSNRRRMRHACVCVNVLSFSLIFPVRQRQSNIQDSERAVYFKLPGSSKFHRHSLCMLSGAAPGYKCVDMGTCTQRSPMTQAP